MIADHAKAAEHYTALLEELNNPITHRLTIEAFSVDPGTDLSACTFGFSRSDDCWSHVVLSATAGQKARVVGLWRIVPDA